MQVLLLQMRFHGSDFWKLAHVRWIQHSHSENLQDGNQRLIQNS